jgi:hypothetical protein
VSSTSSIPPPLHRVQRWSACQPSPQPWQRVHTTHPRSTSSKSKQIFTSRPPVCGQRNSLQERWITRPPTQGLRRPELRHTITADTFFSFFRDLRVEVGWLFGACFWPWPDPNFCKLVVNPARPIGDRASPAALQLPLAFLKLLLFPRDFIGVCECDKTC